MQIPVPICASCKHFNKSRWNCKAFLNGIPEIILIGESDHKDPLPKQDNSIIYEPLKVD